MMPNLTLNLTLDEANVLAQALDLLASDPGLTCENLDDDSPQLVALGYAAFDLSSRVHDAINATSTPSWTDGLRAAMGR